MKFTFCKKQYIYLALAVLSACLALATHVFAQETNAQRSVTNLPTNNLSNIQHDRIINLARNLHARLEATIIRFEQITTRLERRINKLEAQGVSTQNAQDALLRVRTETENARAAMATMIVVLESVPNSESPRATFTEGQSHFTTSLSAIRAAHAHLREVVVLLKNPTQSRSQDSNASSAPPTEVQSTSTAP